MPILPKKFEPREKVFVDEDRHPAVVLRVLSDRVVVAKGTGTLHPKSPSIAVDLRSQAGLSLHLEKTTYFHEFDLHAIEHGKVIRPRDGGRCSILLFKQLEELFAMRLSKE